MSHEQLKLVYCIIKHMFRSIARQTSMLIKLTAFSVYGSEFRTKELCYKWIRLIIGLVMISRSCLWLDWAELCNGFFGGVLGICRYCGH